MQLHHLTDGTIVFPPSGEGKSATLNALPSIASPQQVVSYLAKIADVVLSQDQQEAAAAIYAALPLNASIRDFVNACHADAARQLGVSVERLEALGPLLKALEEAAKPGRYGSLFDGPNAADFKVDG